MIKFCVRNAALICRSSPSFSYQQHNYVNIPYFKAQMSRYLVLSFKLQKQTNERTYGVKLLQWGQILTHFLLRNVSCAVKYNLNVMFLLFGVTLEFLTRYLSSSQGRVGKQCN
jgi:hypothetical protein